MQIACPACQSDYIVVTCASRETHRVSGEFLGAQSWDLVEFERGRPQAAHCGDCGRKLGFSMVVDLLAALTAPAEEHSPFTHDENGEVARCVLLLQAGELREAVSSGDRLLVYKSEDEVVASCRLDAYEWFRAQRPGLNLPEAKEAGTDDREAVVG